MNFLKAVSEPSALRYLYLPDSTSDGFTAEHRSLYIFLTQIYFCKPEIFKTELLKPVFEYKITFWIYVIALWNVNSQRLLCSQKAGV